jgi:hypothetical protein
VLKTWGKFAYLGYQLPPQLDLQIRMDTFSVLMSALKKIANTLHRVKSRCVCFMHMMYASFHVCAFTLHL